MTRLIFVRHGETKTNARGKIHKFVDSESLTSKGVEQIELAAEKLKEYSPTFVYSSREKRAQESAKIISDTLGIPLQIQSGLEERNWGKYVGKSFEEIKKGTGMDKMSLEERYNFTPEGGESWKSFEERLIKGLDSITQKSEGKTIVIVTHGGVIRALVPHLTGSSREESFKYDPDNASISVFEYTKQQVLQSNQQQP